MTQAATETLEFFQDQERLGKEFEEDVLNLFNKYLEKGLAPLSVSAATLGQTLMLMIASATSQIEDKKVAVEDAMNVFNRTVEYVRTTTMDNIDKIVEVMNAPQIEGSENEQR